MLQKQTTFNIHLESCFWPTGRCNSDILLLSPVFGFHQLLRKYLEIKLTLCLTILRSQTLTLPASSYAIVKSNKSEHKTRTSFKMPKGSQELRGTEEVGDTSLWVCLLSNQISLTYCWLIVESYVLFSLDRTRFVSLLVIWTFSYNSIVASCLFCLHFWGYHQDSSAAVGFVSWFIGGNQTILSKSFIQLPHIAQIEWSFVSEAEFATSTTTI